MEMLSQIKDLESSQKSLMQIPEDGQEDIINFTGKSSLCYVFTVDVVNSTHITSRLPSSKTFQYYNIFLNSMAKIAKAFGGTIVKNIGDCLLFYFPVTNEKTGKYDVFDPLDCGLAMTASHRLINNKMSKLKLPKIDYRVSADYGSVLLAESKGVVSNDIFGPVVNFCSKINRMALPNSMVIGGDMHQVVKKFKNYHYNRVSQFSNGFKVSYPVFSVKREL
jgi:adenylate cyclase